MVISTRVKQFLQKIVKFVFCRSKNTTKLLLSGNHNSKVTNHKNIRGCNTTWPIEILFLIFLQHWTRSIFSLIYHNYSSSGRNFKQVRHSKTVDFIMKISMFGSSHSASFAYQTVRQSPCGFI